MNIQFNSKPSNISVWLTNHNGYQIKSKDSMYLLDETQWISNVCTYINRNNQLKEF
jgi:hypothetical protein